MRRALFGVGLLVALVAVVAAACGGGEEVATPVVVTKEVVKEVPVEVVKTVEVPKIVEKEVPVEVVKEVPVEVVKEVVKEVPVEVVKTVVVEKEVEKIVKERDLTIDFVGEAAWLPRHELTVLPFFREEAPKLAREKLPNTTIKFNISSYQELGLFGSEAVKLIQQGVTNIAWFSYGYTGGAVPLTTGVDIATFGQDWQTARKLAEAWLPVVNPVIQDMFNAKLIATHPAPKLIFNCKPEVRSIGDLGGKKIRVWNTMLADFMEGIGGEGVTIAFPEAYSALQTGIVDCGITGSGSANGQRWFEVTNYQYTLSPGWFTQSYAVNLDWWNGLDPDVRDFLENDVLLPAGKMLWEYVGEVDSPMGVKCNAGLATAKECAAALLTRADPGLISTDPSPADLTKMKEVLETVVLPRWVARCGAECARLFNEHLAPIAGFRAPEA